MAESANYLRLLSDSRMHVVALVVVLDSGLLCVPRRRPQKLGSRLARDALRLREVPVRRLFPQLRNPLKVAGRR